MFISFRRRYSTCYPQGYGKQGVPTVKAWQRSAAGKQTWSGTPTGWNRLFCFAAVRLIRYKGVCAHASVCTLTPESRRKFKASTDSLPQAYPVLVLCAFQG